MTGLLNLFSEEGRVGGNSALQSGLAAKAGRFPMRKLYRALLRK